MTTIHSYTNDQASSTSRTKICGERGRPHINMIPTSTGAAKALALVIPDLTGKLDGFSMRVQRPTFRSLTW